MPCIICTLLRNVQQTIMLLPSRYFVYTFAVGAALAELKDITIGGHVLDVDVSGDILIVPTWSENAVAFHRIIK